MTSLQRSASTSDNRLQPSLQQTRSTGRLLQRKLTNTFNTLRRHGSETQFQKDEDLPMGLKEGI